MQAAARCVRVFPYELMVCICLHASLLLLVDILHEADLAYLSGICMMRWLS